MSGADEHKPTRIKRLYIRGYRSIRELELVDLPPIVVFHGENGSGKSNIMRAASLPFRWLGSTLPIADKEQDAEYLPYADADEAIGIRSDDFCKQSPNEIHVQLEIELGSRVSSIVPKIPAGAVLELDFRIRHARNGVDCWLPKANIQPLGSSSPINFGPNDRSKLFSRHILGLTDAYRRILREPIGADDFQTNPHELSSSEQIQQRLYLLATSPDPKERAIVKKLASLLAEISPLFQADGAPPELAAVRNLVFREYETQISRPNAEGIPLSYLGTGEQQLLILLLDVLITKAPIVQIEEPEAHLHKTFMLRLARALQRVIETHDVDQLFIATHHHAFAIAPNYYDITFDAEHGTRAKLTDRAKALQHFYEPSPLWDALRSLVNAGLTENAVLFRDETGRPIHAQEVLASIREEGPLAQKFAEEMTKTILLSMREEAEFGEP